MKDSQPSRTAAWVAACRGLGSVLPPALRLCDDPYGVRFGGPAAEAFERAARRLPWIPLAPPVLVHLLWMQIRTRMIDDVLLEFLRGGGRQLLLLGAGFDCRAARFHRELEGAVVYEVDHPATQQRKRDVLLGARAPSAEVRYLPWNFEREHLADLPARLASLGHDPAAPTLVVWEGVTMYLTEAAIEATVAAIAALSAPGSLLSLTYMDRAHLDGRRPERRVFGALLARAGEPLRFGWTPASLPSWLAARGFALLEDRDTSALAATLVPSLSGARWGEGLQRIAIAARRA